MQSSNRPPPQSGGQKRQRPSLGYLLLALMLIAGSLAFLFFDAAPPQPTAAPAAPQVAQAAAPIPAQQNRAASAASAATNANSALPERDADPTRDLSHYVTRGQNPSVKEVIDRLHQAGIREGIGAFQPPGTSPPLIGLAVPEDFVLPEGYVRHYQATDDGQRIEAILMFAPDRQFIDSAKRPIAIPANRVVPPEYAPPGLPIRRIVIPKALEPGAR